MHLRQKVYLDLEPRFVYDYLSFSANLRFLQSQENSYQKYALPQVAKAMCLVNLLEIYQKSLEDLAAVILAFDRRYNPSTSCQYQTEFSVASTPLSFTLINYTVGEAVLKKILSVCSNDSEIINRFGVSNIEKINITLLYPDIAFDRFYAFVINTLKGLSVDQEKRLKMFNKIKHGGVVVHDARMFASNLPQAPAAIYAQPDAFSADDHPLIMHSLHYTEEEFKLLQHGVMKIMVLIKTLMGIYLCAEYKDFLTEKGYSSSLDLLAEIKMKKYLSLWGGY